jgi:hypothetical protein
MPPRCPKCKRLHTSDQSCWSAFIRLLAGLCVCVCFFGCSQSKRQKSPGCKHIYAKWTEPELYEGDWNHKPTLFQTRQCANCGEIQVRNTSVYSK